MTHRHTVDTITSDALDALYDELDRLRAGEEPGWNPLTVPTPGQWIARWNQATPEKRLQVAEANIRDAETANRCQFEGHRQRLEEDRQAWIALTRVRDEINRWKLNTLEPQTMRAVSDIGRALDGPGPADTDTPSAELTAEEARALADQLGTDLYRAQDALAFVGECCDIADREQRPITTADVREWMKGARCGRQLAADGHSLYEKITAMFSGPLPWPPPEQPHTGLVVEPYRNDRGQPAWVFRCWGTDDGCDGWLSLDHSSQQSAEHARDRHVAEEHTDQTKEQ